jgi:glycosyltransferase involved in cell wall biosynthesis
MHNKEMISSHPLVSVIMPNYNNEKYLAEAIESVLNQSYSNFELIVVDDGSTDGSLEIIKDFDHLLTCISTVNRGAAAARNLGILNSKGSVIAFLDSDDLWKQKKLEVQVKQMIRNDVDLVYCHVQEIDQRGTKGKVIPASHRGYCHDQYVDNPNKAVIIAGMSTVILKKELLAISGLFDKQVPAPTEDWDFLRRYSRIAKVDYSDEVLTEYRLHESNISKSSLKRYFSGNLYSAHKMFMEVNIPFTKRQRIRSRLLLGFLKHLIKSYFEKVRISL